MNNDNTINLKHITDPHECENCGLNDTEFPDVKFSYNFLHMRWECDDCNDGNWDEQVVLGKILNLRN